MVADGGRGNGSTQTARCTEGRVGVSDEYEVVCRFCGTVSRADRIFCLKCRMRLSQASLGLRPDDFTTEMDRSTLSTLMGTEPLPHLVEKVVARGGKRSEAWLEKHALKISPPSRLDALVRSCAELLGIEKLPKGYVAPIDEMNAFTAGRDEDPFFVVCAPVLDVLDFTALQGVVAHELAHVRGRHVLYHTAAESMATGAQIAASVFAAGVVALPIRMLLLSWYRESEASADRASLMVLGNYERFQKVLVGLTRAERGGGPEVADGSLSELLQTHPSVAGRLRLAREFTRTAGYWEGRRRVKQAADASPLTAACQKCGLTSPKSEAFCPGCGISRR